MRKFALSFAALALCVAPAFADDSDFNKTVDLGQKAPSFDGIQAWTPSEKDATKGEVTSLSLADLDEDVVVVVFLANHCPVVTAYEDRIYDFVSDYEGKPVKVVGIACSGLGSPSEDDLDAICERGKGDGKFNYTYGFDATQEIGRAYGATNTPQFFVLDKDRTIRYMGAMDDSQNENKVEKQYVRDAVDSLLSGKEIEVKATRPVGCGIQYSGK